MNSFVAFVKSPRFYIHLVIILSLVALTIFFTLRWLSSYTDHGEFVVVPDFKGQRITALDNFVQGKEVSYQIIDSIYDPGHKSGIVLRQDPEVNTKVKHNRTIYLYVTGMVPPQVIMPKLVDRSERQARLILHSYGLKMGKREEKHADCNGCVLEQQIRGRVIAPGTGVKKGSVVDLVVGKKDGVFTTTLDSNAVEEENLDFE